VRITLAPCARASRRFQTAAGAAAENDKGLIEEFWFALDGGGDGCGAHDSSGRRQFD
jgi:hypothetical protein